ncbi:hypothetical protein EVAR_375_1 [Eumeta japonica]|uniref:Uncharacterized protein n=1 Tax=Eumeta variegata TaxID=151549 RepID=A0A4C1SD24_EUMVA|nr:hypothetical protein EVAR_375_1 [Eumeta japonica]
MLRQGKKRHFPRSGKSFTFPNSKLQKPATFSRTRTPIDGGHFRGDSHIYIQVLVHADRDNGYYSVHLEGGELCSCLVRFKNLRAISSFPCYELISRDILPNRIHCQRRIGLDRSWTAKYALGGKTRGCGHPSQARVLGETSDGSQSRTSCWLS